MVHASNPKPWPPKSRRELEEALLDLKLRDAELEEALLDLKLRNAELKQELGRRSRGFHDKQHAIDELLKILGPTTILRPRFEALLALIWRVDGA